MIWMFLNFSIYSYVYILAESFIIPAHHPPYSLLEEFVKKTKKVKHLYISYNSAMNATSDRKTRIF